MLLDQANRRVAAAQRAQQIVAPRSKPAIEKPLPKPVHVREVFVPAPGTPSMYERQARRTDTEAIGRTVDKLVGKPKKKRSFEFMSDKIKPVALVASTMPEDEKPAVEQPTIPDGPCGESYCLCSGGKHAACKVAAVRDGETREFLLGLGKPAQEEPVEVSPADARAETPTGAGVGEESSQSPVATTIVPHAKAKAKRLASKPAAAPKAVDPEWDLTQGGKTCGVKLPTTVHAALTARAAKNGTSLRQEVIRAIIKGLG